MELFLLQSHLPFAVVGSNDEVKIGNKMVKARQYPWGTVQGIYVWNPTPQPRTLVESVGFFLFVLIQLKVQTFWNGDIAYLLLFMTCQLHSSSDTSVLCLPSVCMHSLGQISFSYAALSVWNSLPCKVRSSDTLTSFKSRLLKLSYWLHVPKCLVFTTVHGSPQYIF